MIVFRLAPGFILGITAMFAVTVPGRAETARLEMKRVPAVSRATSTTSADMMFASRSYQRFYLRTSPTGGTVRTATDAAFADVVKTEPEYVSKDPLRGVANLGDDRYGFAMDSSSEDTEQGSGLAPQSAMRRLKYDRLYFDLNRNGDLTDDQVIRADESPKNSSYSYFPRVDLTIDVAGQETEYAFHMRAYGYSASSYRYAYAYLYGAAFREGEITLDGVKRRVVLVDNNSNGRFDDTMTIATVSGTFYPRPGDTIFVDPDAADFTYGYDPTTSETQHYLGELLHVSGKFFEASVSPAGDSITFKDTAASVGYVSNASKGYRALVRGNQGIVKICCDGNGRSPLPAGNWKLIQYSIDRSKRTVETNGTKQPVWTLVSARAPSDYAAVEIQAGETTPMPFGPPYKPIVKATRRSGNTVQLSMSLVGSGGDVCTNLLVNGGRPSAPEFTILGPDDDEVYQGKFKFG